MAKNEISFEDFLSGVSLDNLGFVQDMHEFLTKNDCGYKIEEAKSGFVFSCVFKKTKKVLFNYVFRKDKMLMRIYADNIGKYVDYLKTLPAEMVREIEKAPDCKRLIDPTKCNQRCPMGFTFELNGTLHQKCKYGCFLLEVKPETQAVLRGFIENELKERQKI